MLLTGSSVLFSRNQILLFSVLVFLIYQSSLISGLAQNATATLSGTVVDQNNAVLANVDTRETLPTQILPEAGGQNLIAVIGGELWSITTNGQRIKKLLPDSTPKIRSIVWTDRQRQVTNLRTRHLVRRIPKTESEHEFSRAGIELWGEAYPELSSCLAIIELGLTDTPSGVRCWCCHLEHLFIFKVLAARTVGTANLVQQILKSDLRLFMRSRHLFVEYFEEGLEREQTHFAYYAKHN